MELIAGHKFRLIEFCQSTTFNVKFSKIDYILNKLN